MAEIKSFPNNQDEYIGAEEVMKWLHGRTSGVFGAENNAAVYAVQDSMAVEVSDGIGWISNSEGNGVVWWNESEKTNGSRLFFPIDVADGALDRIDRVVVSWETTNYVARPTISILKGTKSSRAVAPALTNNSVMRQISLAQISVPAGTISLSPTLITDERLNPSVCGIVTESITVDTSMASVQFTELLDLIQRNLEQIVSGEISDGAITTQKLADGAVTDRKLAPGAVTAESIGALSISDRIAHSLLDNSDFTQFVAQAGIGGRHGMQSYAGDRWILDSGTVTGEANDNGNGYKNITLNGSIRQKVANPPTVGTAFVEMVSGTAAVSYSNGEVTVTSSGGVIKNVALYEGEYTADNRPKYMPKGYAVELAECQRYVVPWNAYDRIHSTLVNASTIDFLLPVPQTLRTTPSISDEMFVASFAGAAQDGFSIVVKSGSNAPGFVQFRATKANHGLTNGALLEVHVKAILCADLE